MIKDGLYYWENTATKLLEELGIVAGESTRQMRSWPKTAQGLGNCLERCAPLLRAKGITIERKHSGVRLIVLSRVREEPAPAQGNYEF